MDASLRSAWRAADQQTRSTVTARHGQSSTSSAHETMSSPSGSTSSSVIASPTRPRMVGTSSNTWESGPSTAPEDRVGSATGFRRGSWCRTCVGRLAWRRRAWRRSRRPQRSERLGRVHPAAPRGRPGVQRRGSGTGRVVRSAPRLQTDDHCGVQPGPDDVARPLRDPRPDLLTRADGRSPIPPSPCWRGRSSPSRSTPDRSSRPWPPQARASSGRPGRWIPI